MKTVELPNPKPITCIKLRESLFCVYEIYFSSADQTWRMVELYAIRVSGIWDRNLYTNVSQADPFKE